MLLSLKQITIALGSGLALQHDANMKKMATFLPFKKLGEKPACWTASFIYLFLGPPYIYFFFLVLWEFSDWCNTNAFLATRTILKALNGKKKTCDNWGIFTVLKIDKICKRAHNSLIRRLQLRPLNWVVLFFLWRFSFGISFHRLETEHGLIGLWIAPQLWVCEEAVCVLWPAGCIFASNPLTAGIASSTLCDPD